jgi:hypothetical protein
MVVFMAFVREMFVMVARERKGGGGREIERKRE